MASLRAKLRALESFENDATTSEATTTATTTAKARRERSGSPRTPASGTWNASTRVTGSRAPNDSARATAGRRWRDAARRTRDATAERDEGDGGREGGMRSVVSRARAMRGFADVVEAAAAGREARRGVTVSPEDAAKAEATTTTATTTTAAKRTPREIILQRSLAMRRGRLDGDVESTKARAATEEVFKLKKRETNDVEEEVLKILRDVVEETRDERARSNRSSGNEGTAMMTATAAAGGATIAPAPTPTPNESERAKNKSSIGIAVVIISALIGVLCGCTLTLAPTSGVADAVVSPPAVTPSATFDLAGADLDASLMAQLDRARLVHDALTDESHRKRIRVAAKRASLARRAAAERIAASVGGEADPAGEQIQLAESTCRAVRAFSELHRAVDDAD